MDPGGELISLAELAAYLGKSRQCIYQWRARGAFPFRLVGQGRGLKVYREEVEQYLAGRTEGPREVGGSAAAWEVPFLEVALAAGTRLEDAAELIRRAQRGAEISIVLGEEGCVLRVGS